MNYTHRALNVSRTFHEATGRRIHKEDFADGSRTADKIVFWSCVAVGLSLIVAALCGVQIGG